MKSACLGILVCLVLLQACTSQPKAGDGGKDGQPQANQPKDTTAAPGTPGAAPQGPTPEQLAKMPKSQRLFMESKNALEKGDAAGCSKILDEALTNAEQEKNVLACILINETQAKLKDVEKASDEAGAIKNKLAAAKILDDTVAKYSKTNNLQVSQRLDLTKFLAAGMYAFARQPEKADKIYQDTIKFAKTEKPENHVRVAFCMKAYSEFLKYNKHDKESQAMLAQATAEAKKK